MKTQFFSVESVESDHVYKAILNALMNIAESKYGNFVIKGDSHVWKTSPLTKGDDLYVQTDKEYVENKQGNEIDAAVYLNHVCREYRLKYRCVMFTDRNREQFSDVAYVHPCIAIENQRKKWIVIDVSDSAQNYSKYECNTFNEAVALRFTIWAKDGKRNPLMCGIHQGLAYPRGGKSFDAWFAQLHFISIPMSTIKAEIETYLKYDFSNEALALQRDAKWTTKKNSSETPLQDLIPYIEKLKSLPYGLYGTNKKRLTNEEGDPQCIQVQSPKMYLKNGYGMCHDASMAIGTKCDDLDIEFKLVVLFTGMKTHSFIVIHDVGGFYVIDIYGTENGYCPEPFITEWKAIAYRIHTWCNEEELDTESVMVQVLNEHDFSKLTVPILCDKWLQDCKRMGEGYNGSKFNGSEPTFIYKPVIEIDLDSVEPYGEFPEGLEDKIRERALPHYHQDGPNAMPHLQRVLNHGYYLCRQRNSPMTILEYATIMYHDVAKYTCGRENHGVVAARIARDELKDIFETKDLAAICRAIADHDFKEKVPASDLGDFLMSADANLPDIGWYLTKVYIKGIVNYHRSHYQAVKDAVKYTKLGYPVLDDYVKRPKLWTIAYGKYVDAVRKQCKRLTTAQGEIILRVYAKRHPEHNSFEQLLEHPRNDSLTSTEGFSDQSAQEPDIPYTSNYYVCDNFPYQAFCNALHDEYHTTKLDKLAYCLGVKRGYSSRQVAIHNFFIPEILYLLNKFEFPPSLINEIYNKTWVSKEPVYHTKSNPAALKKQMPKVKFLKHQQEFLDQYVNLKDGNHLNGYLLSFDQGLGKTMTAIGLMEQLEKDKIIIICPKNTMEETWEYHIKTFVASNNTAYVHSSPCSKTAYNNAVKCRYEIYNYDALPYVLQHLKDGHYANKTVGVILDESHNFLREAAKRVQLMVELTNGLRSVPTTDILLMSGTPLKCYGAEMIPMLQMLDPLFDQEAKDMFKDIFGYTVSAAQDVLNARINRVMYRVLRDTLGDSLPDKHELYNMVKMPTGRNYTLSSVKLEIEKYTKERYAYHTKMMPIYEKEVMEALDYVEKTAEGKTSEFESYCSFIIWLHDNQDKIREVGEKIQEANKYEREVFEPLLPTELKKKFQHGKTAYKYLSLKIKGEVLGDLLTRLRMQMTCEMLPASDLVKIIQFAKKKTVVFTSFVETIELCDTYLRQKGMKPLMVYGKNIDMLPQTLDAFKTDPKFNPLIASLKTLSTGATLTVANTVVFVNKPWRSIEYQQASDRVHRIGQDTEVYIYTMLLDTGKEGNLSTRMEDIMKWSDEQFGAIVDGRDVSKDPTSDDAIAAAFHMPSDVLYDPMNKLKQLLGFEGIDPESVDMISEEKFWSVRKDVSDTMKKIPKIDLNKLLASAEPGDLIIPWLKYDMLQGMDKVNNIANMAAEGCSFVSCKIILHNGIVCGYGVGETLNLEKVPLTQYLEHCGGAVLLRHKKRTPEVVRKVIDFIEYVYKHDNSYNRNGVIHTLFRKWFNQDPTFVLGKVSRSRKATHYCTSVMAAAYQFAKCPILLKDGTSATFSLPRDFIANTVSFDYIGCYYDPIDEKSTTNMVVSNLLPRLFNWKSELEELTYVVPDSVPSLEGTVAGKKKDILAYICKICDIADPTHYNSNYYRELIGGMNEKEFAEFMNNVKSGKFKMHLLAPNMKVALQNTNLLKAADELGLKMFHKIWFHDKVTGKKYLSDNEYMVVQLPIRRQQQFLDEKMSVPDDDKSIDGLTGQVTADSKSCGVTNPEIQILAARGLEATLHEFVSVRGGSIANYAEFKRNLEETGSASLNTLDASNRPRATVTAGILLRGMHLRSNI